jgi:Cd2+/Zn2+-exporting ATPase
LMTVAGSIESRSSHPIANAIVRRAKEEDPDLFAPEEFEELSGRGVKGDIEGDRYLIGNERFLTENGIGLDIGKEFIEAFETQGKTVVLVGSRSELIGILAIADQLKPEAKDVIDRIKRSGIKTVMLTGDNERSAKAIAQQVGVDEYYAHLLPDEKVSLIKELKGRYGSVAMVGDGINDAPAMAVSDVGIAMGAAGTDIAIETGDIVLMSDDLSKIEYVRELSRRTVRNIQQNIAISLVNIGFMVMAALIGLLGLVTGLLLNEASALIVIANALRLLTTKFDHFPPMNANFGGSTKKTDADVPEGAM